MSDYYILMEKVIILMKTQVTMMFLLHHSSTISVWAWTEKNVR